jgi:hypothetical protein
VPGQQATSPHPLWCQERVHPRISFCSFAFAEPTFLRRSGDRLDAVSVPTKAIVTYHQRFNCHSRTTIHGAFRTCRPSSIWVSSHTLSAIASSRNVTKPKPRGFPVARSFMTICAQDHPGDQIRQAPKARRTKYCSEAEDAPLRLLSHTPQNEHGRPLWPHRSTPRHDLARPRRKKNIIETMAGPQ